MAPAGSYESMIAAFAAGADAVYIGGKRFGARAYADNPKDEDILRAVSYAHEREKKLYLTVNTLLKDREMEELYAYLNPFYREGLDAVIVQDWGVFSFVRDAFPGMDIHASTQMGITGVYGAKLAKEMGASRVVTARELSLKEIAAIHERADIEIESFVHGALCFCYSGQCLFSSLIGGRSGNRGRCAQPCRLPYDLLDERGALREKDRYLLSPRNLCALDLLPDILDAGVYSLKIEGRMKSPEYTAGVTRIYRRCLERLAQRGRDGYFVREEEKRELLDLYDRGGFSTGYYRRHNGPEMIWAKRPSVPQKDTARSEKLADELRRTFLEPENSVKINGKLRLCAQKPAILEVSCKGRQAQVSGPLVQTAQSRPLTKEEAERRIRKTGGSGYVFDRLSLEAEDGIFFPAGELNRLRRSAIDALREEMAEEYRRQDGSLRGAKQREDQGAPSDTEPSACTLTVSLEDAESFSSLCRIQEVRTICLDCCAFPARRAFLERSAEYIRQAHETGKECVYILPWIFREQALSYYRWEDAGKVLELYDAVLLRNQEEFAFLREHGYSGRMAADWNLYTFNREAAGFWRQAGLSWDTVPPELNRHEIRERGCRDSELLVYGYQPLMVTAQCQVKNTMGCEKKPRTLYLKDRMQKRFRVVNRCMFCYNVIYNSTPLELYANAEEIKKLGPRSIRLQFTKETAQETLRTVRDYADAFFGTGRLERDVKEFTRGHFGRGVE